MSRLLQVVMDDGEYAEIEALAQRQGKTVSEWVRAAALCDSRSQQPRQSQARKLAALRNALTYEFPTGDIEELLGEEGGSRAAMDTPTESVRSAPDTPPPCPQPPTPTT